MNNVAKKSSPINKISTKINVKNVSMCRIDLYASERWTVGKTNKLLFTLEAQIARQWRNAQENKNDQWKSRLYAHRYQIY